MSSLCHGAAAGLSEAGAGDGFSGAGVGAGAAAPGGGAGSGGVSPPSSSYRQEKSTMFSRPAQCN